MGNVFQFGWEVTLIEWLQETVAQLPFLKTLAVMITTIGEPGLTVVLIGYLYFGYLKDTSIYFTMCLAGTQLFNSMIKNIFDRLRPYFANETIECLKVPEDKYDMYDVSKQGYSFPSGHSSNAAALLTALWYKTKNRKILLWGSIIVFLIGLSRSTLGVHYPSDVLCGFASGIGITTLIEYTNKKVEKKKYYMIILFFSSLGLFFCETNDYFSTLGLIYGFTLGNLFEEKYVKFKETRNVLTILIRTAIGGLLFFAVSNLIKLPFSAEFLDSATIASHLLRTFRYFCSTFVTIGLSPYLFKIPFLKASE